MSLTALEADLAIHQKLPDEPNDVGGLSAEALKEKFDEAGLTIQRYLNDTHLPEVEGAIRDTLAEARTYTDRKVVAVGVGDMASAIYDTMGRRQDVYDYAHSEAVNVLGSAARFGCVYLGPAEGSSRNGETAVVTPAGGADPRRLWNAGEEAFVVPQGANTFGATVSLRWARQIFNMVQVQLTVNGEVAAACSGPNYSDGQYRDGTVMLSAPVTGGDRVQVRLVTQPVSGVSNEGQAAAAAMFLRAEILM